MVSKFIKNNIKRNFQKYFQGENVCFKINFYHIIILEVECLDIGFCCSLVFQLRHLANEFNHSLVSSVFEIAVLVRNIRDYKVMAMVTV